MHLIDQFFMFCCLMVGIYLGSRQQKNKHSLEERNLICDKYRDVFDTEKQRSIFLTEKEAYYILSYNQIIMIIKIIY